MDHDVALGGHGYALRPVALGDAALIVSLRRASGPYLNRGAQTEDEQRAWIERYLARDGDCCFVVERASDGGPEGLAAIYDIDAPAGAAEWGRFVVRHGSNAAVEAARLVYRCAFEIMALERLVCRTLAANAHVVAFHDSCGLVRAPGEVTVMHDGMPVPAIEHRLDRARWPVVDARLEPLAKRIAARMERRPA